MTNKEKYILLCQQEESIPVFSQPWWMDAVCINGYWDVVLYEKDGIISGALPYYVKKRFGISYITQPQLTQNNGIIIKYPDNQKYEKKLSYEKEIMTALIEQLEKLPIKFYQQGFNSRYTNWLPFYWKGYKQTTRYTYVIKDISNIENVVAAFDPKKRGHLRKGMKNLQIQYDLSAEKFIQYYKECLRKKDDKLLYSEDSFCRLYNAAYANKSGRSVYAIDVDNQIHGAIFYVWDKFSAYDLVTAFDPNYKDSGASTLLVYQLIKDSSVYCKVFDFEGSMIEGVEESFRKFGTIQTPYFFISKVMTKNPIIRFFINRKLM